MVWIVVDKVMTEKMFAFEKGIDAAEFVRRTNAILGYDEFVSEQVDVLESVPDLRQCKRCHDPVVAATGEGVLGRCYGSRDGGHEIGDD